MSEKLHVPESPCSSCPYRCDTPPGVWDRSEYEKLRQYDDNSTFATFLCHYSTIVDRKSVCRGWLTVHAESVAVRLAVLHGEVTIEEVRAKVKEKLYRTGNSAANAGIRGVAKPSVKARRVSLNILKAREKT